VASKFGSSFLIAALLALSMAVVGPVAAAGTAKQPEQSESAQPNADNASEDEDSSDAATSSGETVECSTLADPMKRDACFAHLLRGLGATKGTGNARGGGHSGSRAGAYGQSSSRKRQHFSTAIPTGGGHQSHKAIAAKAKHKGGPHD